MASKQTQHIRPPRATPTVEPRGRTLVPWTFFLSIFFDMLTLGMLIPLSPQYQMRLGLSHSALGLLKFTYGLLQTLSVPVLGMLADRWGKRPVMMVSLLGTATSYWFTTYACLHRSINAFYISRLLTGATRQTMSVGGAVVTRAYAQGLPQRGEARRSAVSAGMSRLSFWASAAFSAGPILGGLVADQWGLERTIVAAAVIAYLNAMIMFFSMGTLGEDPNPDDHTSLTADKNMPSNKQMRTSTNTKEKRETRSYWWRSTPLGFVWRTLFQEEGNAKYLLLCLLLQSFAFQMANTSLSTLLAAVSRNEYSLTAAELPNTAMLDLPASNPPPAPSSPTGTISFTTTGSILALVNLTWTFAQFMLPTILKRFLSYHIAMTAMCSACVGYAIQVQSSASVSWLCVGLFISALSSGMADTVNKSTFSAAYKAGSGGEVMSVVYSIDGFNKAVAPLVWGLLMDHSSTTTTTTTAAMVRRSNFSSSSSSATLPCCAGLMATSLASMMYLLLVLPGLRAEERREQQKRD